MHYAIKILLLCIRYPIRAPSKQALKIFKNTSASGTKRTLRFDTPGAENGQLQTLALNCNGLSTGFGM